MSIDQDSDDFMRCVLESIDKGCRYRTHTILACIGLSLYLSLSLSKSREWRFMADDETQPTRAGWSERGSQPSKSASQSMENQERVAVRIDIWEWYLSGDMPRKGLIDLSSDVAQRKLFGRGFFGWNEQDAMKGFRNSISGGPDQVVGPRTGRILMGCQ